TQIVVTVIHSHYGRSQADHPFYPIIGASGSQADRGSESASGKHQWQEEFAFEPIESGASIVHFVLASAMLPLTQAGSAEIEAQHGKSETVQGLHGVKDNFVMQSSAEKRMGVANQG